MLWSNGIRGPTRFGKALNLIFPKLSSQNMRGFDYATIPIPSFHGLRKERLAQCPLLCPKYEEKRILDYESRCLRKWDQTVR